MPKKKTKTAAVVEKPKFTTAKAVLYPSDDAPTYYINFAEVSRSQHEFMLTCAKGPSKLTPAQAAAAGESGEIRLEPVVQLIIPPTLINGLIAALEAQRTKYERDHGVTLPKAAPIDSGEKKHATKH
jgi:hypothetical protein